jgi:drug/metabolite transporter (DMT)-like permease
MGVVSFVAPNICFSYADRGIKVGVASVLMSITPIFVLLFGQVLR